MFVNYVSYFLIIVALSVGVHSQLCDTLTNTGICKPKCKSSCENGYCVKPEECACNAGYTKRFNTCIPVCERYCSHGTCVAPDKCLCHSGYNLVNGTCQPKCRYPCGSGTCVFPNLCYCYPGFQINYFRHFGHEVGPVCEPIKAIKKRFSIRNEYPMATTNRPFITSTLKDNGYATGDTTTTTKDPVITTTTYNNYKYHTEDTTTTTITPYFERSSSSEATVLENEANNNVTSADMIQKSWMQQYGTYIWVPILLILSTVLILLLVWQGAPMAIINYYKGVKNRRSYNVEGAFQKQDASSPFDYSLLNIRTEEKEAQS